MERRIVMPQWNDAQQNAIDARNSNILVSAAAGSGKTAVLVERIIKMITDENNPIDIDKLLVVTFTNAAAAEMKNRIIKKLNDIVKSEPNNSNASRQLSLVPNAKICTTDSFCINLVREYFFKLDILQDFKILDESQLRLIEGNCANTVLENLYNSENDRFYSLAEFLSESKNDDELIQTIKRVHQYIMAHPFPFEWLRNSCEIYNPTLKIDDTVFKKLVFDEVIECAEYAIDIINLSVNELVQDEMYDAYYDMLEKDKCIFQFLANIVNTDWDSVVSTISSYKFINMPRAKKGYASSNKDFVNNNRAIYKKLFTDNILPLFSVTAEEYIQDCAILYPVLLELYDVVKLFNDELFKLKREMNAYSFSDIEHFAIELLYEKNENGELVKTEIAKGFENEFAEILIDEYQDTNAAQDTLYEMLSNGQNRFMVGDVKQSIYRFRLAMPQIFTAKKDTFDLYDKKSDSINQKIIFAKNYRSRKGICDYTNFLFSAVMNKKIGELDYNEEEYLNNGADYEETSVPSAQIKLIQTPAEEDADEFEAKHLAELIVKKINSKEKIKDGEHYRDICFGDIAVVFRSTKNQVPVFEKVLTQYGIPVVTNNKTNLFDNNEISILISLLRVIDNPLQDIPLLSTLMSVFYGYTPDDIANARVKHPYGNLYSSICKDKKTFGAFIDDIEKYKKYASSMSVEDFLRQIISDTSYLSVISAFSDAEQRKLNVMKFVDLAKRFDNGDSVGLTAFVRYIDSVKNSKLSLESANISHIGSNSVSLMSIHQSKGLEFPVCILAGSSHLYNIDDLKGKVQFHPQFGIGMKILNEKYMYRYNSLQYSCIKNFNKFALMSENLRVLYVAVTRAKEQFISLVSKKDMSAYVSSLANKIINGRISPVVSSNFRADSDFIISSALLHKNSEILVDMLDDRVINPVDTDFDLSIEWLGNENARTEDDKKIAEKTQPTMVDEIRNKLSYRYDRLNLSSFSSKRTASSLDEKEQNYKFFASSKPAFMNDKGMTSAQKGTAMHAFMQYCDYKNAKNNLEAEIERLVSNAYITKEQGDSLNRSRLNNLFHSGFANRMFNSDRIYREIKVSSFVPVCEIEDTNYEDQVLIQGIADCVFEENGELVVVDYKTDRVESEEELLSLYKHQLQFYKKAVAKTLNKPVKEAMLYSFSLNKECIYK